jgi:MmyB-like transcription regulator ligand binding domain
VGDLTLRYESFALPAHPGLAVVMYAAEPGSASEMALRELQQWAAARERLASVQTLG